MLCSLQRQVGPAQARSSADEDRVIGGSVAPLPRGSSGTSGACGDPGARGPARSELRRCASRRRRAQAPRSVVLPIFLDPTGARVIAGRCGTACRARPSSSARTRSTFPPTSSRSRACFAFEKFRCATAVPLQADSGGGEQQEQQEAARRTSRHATRRGRRPGRCLFRDGRLRHRSRLAIATPRRHRCIQSLVAQGAPHAGRAREDPLDEHDVHTTIGAEVRTVTARSRMTSARRGGPPRKPKRPRTSAQNVVPRVSASVSRSRSSRVPTPATAPNSTTVPRRSGGAFVGVGSMEFSTTAARIQNRGVERERADRVPPPPPPDKNIRGPRELLPRTRGAFAFSAFISRRRAGRGRHRARTSADVQLRAESPPGNSDVALMCAANAPWPAELESGGVDEGTRRSVNCISAAHMAAHDVLVSMFGADCRGRLRVLGRTAAVRGTGSRPVPKLRGEVCHGRIVSRDVADSRWRQPTPPPPSAAASCAITAARSRATSPAARRARPSLGTRMRPSRRPGSAQVCC